MNSKTQQKFWKQENCKSAKWAEPNTDSDSRKDREITQEREVLRRTFQPPLSCRNPLMVPGRSASPAELLGHRRPLGEEEQSTMKTRTGLEPLVLSSFTLNEYTEISAD